jgi:hypothetical protein
MHECAAVAASRDANANANARGRDARARRRARGDALQRVDARRSNRATETDGIRRARVDA